MLLQAAVPKKTRSTAAPLHPSTPRPNIRCRASSQDPTVLLTNGLHRPIDCLLNAKATIHSMQLMLNAATQCEDRVLVLQDVELVKLSILPALDLITQRHPELAWKQAAAVAAQLLEEAGSGFTHMQSELMGPANSAAVATKAANGSADAAMLHGGLGTVSSSNDSSQVVQQVQQLQDWLQELLSLEEAAKAAVLQVVQDADLSPVLLLNEAAAQQHPLWAADFKAWQQQQQQLPEQQQQNGLCATNIAAANVTIKSKTCLQLQLPAVQQLQVSDSVQLPIAQCYATAAEAVADAVHVIQQQQYQQLTPDGPSLPGRLMPWPLTGSAAAALLASPPGLLSDGQLQAVYQIGLVARVQAMAAAVDLTHLLQQEAHSTNEQLQHTLQRLNKLQEAVDDGGAAVQRRWQQPQQQPHGVPSSLSGSAVGHPAVAAAFLEELGTFSKRPAADELHTFLSICSRQLAMTGDLGNSGGSTANSQAQQQEKQGGGWQLPKHLSGLQPFQVEGLRQLVSIIECEQLAAASASSRIRKHNSSVESWLQDYTDTEQLLAGACELLGCTFNLAMHCTAAPAGTTWCQEAYVITVDDAAPPAQQHTARKVVAAAAGGSSGSSHLGSGGGRRLGKVLVLFDSQYAGLPYTANVSQGGYYQVTPPPDQHNRNLESHYHHGSTAFQPSTVAIIFPAPFCSQHISSSGSASCSSTSVADGSSNSRSSSRAAGSGMISCSSKLSTLLHELGHALHFVLSATALGASSADCSCWAAPDICEAVAHLTERMARDARCLQVLLRHRHTGQPPPVSLTRQLQLHLVISSRGPYQWQQHVMAALTDARLAAAAAAAAAAPGGSSDGDGAGGVSCWDVMMGVVNEYEPLPDKGLHLALLTYLPAAAIMPGQAYSYIFAELVSAAVWAQYLQADPLDPAAGLAVRRLLFDASAQMGTVAVVERMLGQESMRLMEVKPLDAAGVPASETSVRVQNANAVCDGAASATVVGFVPNLEHAAFRDIDLWT